jgi:hypothetical protein
VGTGVVSPMAGCGVWAYGLRRGEFRCGRNGSGIGGGSVRSGAVVAGVRAGGLLRENAELGFCAGGGAGSGFMGWIRDFADLGFCAGGGAGSGFMGWIRENADLGFCAGRGAGSVGVRPGGSIRDLWEMRPGRVSAADAGFRQRSWLGCLGGWQVPCR